MMKRKKGQGQGPDAVNPIVFFDITRDNESIGRITFELFESIVPKTVENFRSIVSGENNQNYNYLNSVFFRIKGGFMAQGGDIENQDGTGGKSIYGKVFDDEMGGLLMSHNKRGILSMANKGKNSNSSQFFITFKRTDWLDGYHVVFGEMLTGEKILRVMEVGGSQCGKPTSTFAIKKCGELDPKTFDEI